MNLEKENNLFLKEGERIDDLERNGYKIIQDRKRFCFGMDAVLLSGFAQRKRKSFGYGNRHRNYPNIA